MRIVIGYDEREAQAWHVCAQSIIDHASATVQIIPLALRHLRYIETHRGTNAFVHSRFLVPALCDFAGFALYMDSDMQFRTDPLELWKQRDVFMACQIVKHDYRTKHPRKYVGSRMESDNHDYPRKNWSSLILWNCSYYGHRMLTPEFVQRADSKYLHRFEWLPDDRIGNLPSEWNWLVGEQKYNPSAKIVHHTLGVPTLEGHRYYGTDYAAEWHAAVERVNRCG